MRTANSRDPSPTPTPIPTFSPMLRPVDVVEAAVLLVTGCEVGKRDGLLVVGLLMEVELLVEIELVTELLVLGELLVVELLVEVAMTTNWLFATFQVAVVIGFDGSTSNRPTPLSQHPACT